MQPLLHIKKLNDSEAKYTVQSDESMYDDLPYTEALETLSELEMCPEQRHVEMFLQASELTAGVDVGGAEIDADGGEYRFQRRAIEGTCRGDHFQATVARFFYKYHPVSQVKVNITACVGHESEIKEELMKHVRRLI